MRAWQRVLGNITLGLGSCGRIQLDSCDTLVSICIRMCVCMFESVWTWRDDAAWTFWTLRYGLRLRYIRHRWPTYTHTHTYTYRHYCRPAVCLLIKKPIKKEWKKDIVNENENENEKLWKYVQVLHARQAHRLNYFPIYRSIFFVVVVVFHVVHNLLVISTLYPVGA